MRSGSERYALYKVVIVGFAELKVCAGGEVMMR